MIIYIYVTSDEETNVNATAFRNEEDAKKKLKADYESVRKRFLEEDEEERGLDDDWCECGQAFISYANYNLWWRGEILIRKI